MKIFAAVHVLPGPRAKRRGFTLTELAIVIGIIGLLTAAIWSFIGPAFQKQRTQQALEEIATVAKNVRAFYEGQTGMPLLGVNTLSSTLITEGVIPGYMVRTPTPSPTCSNQNGLCADNPWGPSNGGTVDPQGSFDVCDWNQAATPTQTACNQSSSPSTGTTQFFAVVFRGLNQQNCVALMTEGSVPSLAPGLVAVTVSNCESAAGAGLSLPIPVPTATAATDCSCAAGTPNNIVHFVYRLNPGNF